MAVLLAGMLFSGKAQAVTPSAQAVLANMLSRESGVAYTAREITTIWKRTPIVSEQIVSKAGLKGKRVEYITPSRLRGEVIIDNGSRLYDYSAQHRLLRIRASKLATHRAHNIKTLGQLKHGKLRIRLIGREKVAGRSAYVIEVRAKSNRPSHARRIWIDMQKWVKLRTEDVNSNGKVASTSRYTSIRFVNSLPASTFKASFTKGVRIIREPAPQRLSTIAEAQKSVPFRIMHPAYLPSGYVLEGVLVRNYRQGKIVSIRYSDGVNSFSLFESPGRMLSKNFVKRLLKGPVRPASDTYSWRRRDVSLTLVGNLGDSLFRKIALSVR